MSTESIKLFTHESFREQNPQEERQKKSLDFRKHRPGDIPCIIELVSNDFRLEKEKYGISQEKTLGQLIESIREKGHFQNINQVIWPKWIILIKDNFIYSKEQMSTLDQLYQDEDGFLYITILQLNALQKPEKQLSQWTRDWIKRNVKKVLVYLKKAKNAQDLSMHHPILLLNSTDEFVNVQNIVRTFVNNLQPEEALHYFVNDNIPNATNLLAELVKDKQYPFIVVELARESTFGSL